MCKRSFLKKNSFIRIMFIHVSILNKSYWFLLGLILWNFVMAVTQLKIAMLLHHRYFLKVSFAKFNWWNMSDKISHIFHSKILVANNPSMRQTWHVFMELALDKIYVLDLKIFISWIVSIYIKKLYLICQIHFWKIKLQNVRKMHKERTFYRIFLHRV